MNRNINPTRRARIAMTWALILTAGLGGCGPSSEVIEIPEAARKSVLRKKVDDQPRSSAAKKARQGSPKGR